MSGDQEHIRKEMAVTSLMFKVMSDSAEVRYENLKTSVGLTGNSSRIQSRYFTNTSQ